MSEFFRAFRELLKMPAGLWLVIFAFSVDAIAYFGVLTLMTIYMHEDIGMSDAMSGVCVSFFTTFVTLFMIGAGGAVERIGIRKGVLFALALCLVGRIIYCGAAPTGGLAVPLIVISLVVVALGEGILQPVAYAGIKRYTTEGSSSMGYAMLYAFMNLGIVIVGLISPLVRVPVEAAAKAGRSPISGVAAVGWTCMGITLFCTLFYFLFMTRKVEANVVRVTDAEPQAGPKASMGARIKAYILEGPFSESRFLFFIFMLLPVRTLFAHQWLTLPNYVLRAYPPAVADKMEWIVNWINPGIIFIGVPTLTAMTKRYHVYTMMIIGSAVSAVPTFLLCLGPSLPMLITYLVIFSIGEALWSARFLEYSAELAPEGKVAQYMGLANVPWIVAKLTTGLYSGAMLQRFCPEGGPLHTETMWFIYGCIALTSPIGLLLARGWVMRGQRSMGAAAA